MNTLRIALLASFISISLAGTATPTASTASTPQKSETAPAGPATEVRSARRLVWNGAIHPLAREILCAAAAKAAAENALFILQLDTPGGGGDSMTAIIRCFEESPTPVVVWVAPNQAGATSAGSFISMAADVVVMAPGTRIGSASIIFMPSIPGQSTGLDTESAKNLMKKAMEFHASQMRELALRHGREAKAAEAMVTDSKNYTAEEALANGLSDALAADDDALRTALRGREIRKGGARFIIGELASFTDTPFTRRQRFLNGLADPNLSFLLFIVGSFGIALEYKAPGAWYPGVLGGLCLILFALSVALLPFHAVGIALLVLAFALYLAELKIVSHGALAVGGTACLVLGGLLLYPGPEPALRISPVILWGTSAAALLAVLALAALVLRSRRRGAMTGASGMVGEWGTVFSPVDKASGMVRVRGELWHAVTHGANTLPVGLGISVIAVCDLTVMVIPKDPPACNAGLC